MPFFFLFSDVPSKELFEKLLSDSIFVDYLNTFLSLPVFGKRFCYNREADNFSIEPSPPRTCYHLSRYRVKEWVRKERLKFFWKTDLFLEYLLCNHLQEAAESSNTSVDRQQTRCYLDSVESMRNFHLYLRGTMGQRILFFWIDAEQFRRVTKKDHRRFAFREIQNKYLGSGSPRELPEIMKWASMCGVSDDLGKRSSFKFPKSVVNRMYLSDASIFSKNAFVCGQKMAVDRLVCYWVPKFIEHKKKIRGILEEKRRLQSVFVPRDKPFAPVWESIPEIIVTKQDSQEEMDDFMEAQCVSSTESVIENKDEIRASRLEEWKRWFWEGVDEDQLDNEEKVEPPEDMPEELRQLGGIRNGSSPCLLTPEEEEDRSMLESPLSTNARPRDKPYSESFCFPPKSLPSSPEQRSVSEPAFSTTSLLEWYQWHEEFQVQLKNAEEQEKWEVLEEKRVNLPRLPQPYAFLPTATTKKRKTQYEALASEPSTDRVTVQLYGSPDRSESASPPRSAIVALQRASFARLIPFEDTGNEIAAFVGEPRSAYPRETPLPEQFNRAGYHSSGDMYFTSEVTAAALVALTGDKLAGGPLREYLEKTRNCEALKSVQLWEDAQQYLSPVEDFGSFSKFHLAKTLIATYIAPNSPRKIAMSPSVRDDLMRLLPEGKGDSLLTSVVDNCIQAVALPWSEYIRLDEDHFVCTVGIRRKSETKAVNSKTDQRRKAIFLGDSGSKFRALALAARVGVIGISLGQDDEDKEEVEALNEEFKIPSLRDHVKALEELNAKKRRMSHFYGQASNHGEETPEAKKKTTSTKMRTPKPRSFNDILYEPAQMMGFKKFLSEKNGEVPLMFWQAVENMKGNCKDAKARQVRATSIARKYFINIPTSAVEYLNCKAEIIRDIPTLDKVTPPMLVSAQACVARSMEENWYAEYLATFPEEENEGESFAKYAMRNTLAGVCKMTTHGKTRGLWVMFAQSVMLLQRGIRNPELVEEFKQFLIKETKTTIEQNQRRHAPHPARRMVNSKIVNVDRLMMDLEFWLEVERFKNLADHAAECARSGNYTLEDEKLLLDKAKALVKCFIDSDVPPRVQVNIPNDTAENIVGLVQSGIIERGLFHDAAMSVFLPLMFFWKKFSAERNSNPPVEVKPHPTSASTNKRPISRGRVHSLICGMPYRRLYMPNGDDEILWSYSLNHGLRLVLPLKYAIGKRVATQLGRRSRSTGPSGSVSLPRPTP
ncbi:regulator of G-protein signaling protein-like [Montipora foliosa]|uniref:regulator of G-protein signaling protein-like n=1 Tax=Montipora foliosa TaxID=591990 RepID=UPI0035F15A90